MADEPKLAPVTDRPHAPIVYFEDAPALAHVNGIIAVTLCAQFQLPEVDGVGVQNDRMVTAYLRTNIIGARVLIDALNKGLLLANPPESAAKN